MSTTKESAFDDIRPYRDDEIPAAMQRIAASEFFPLLATYIFPDEELESVRERVMQIRTIREFQGEVMKPVNEQVIARSISSFSCEGLERLDPSQRYLFVSNHRDIMLDASLLQYLLFVNGHETSEITFGANLMSSPLVIDIGKANKMFRIERGGNMKDFYRSSMHCSEYIRHTITEKRQSVWIAQRNGRTKDGNDLTDQGIVKMFCMSRPFDKIEALAELHIVPMTISYEWEPCDILKALELYESRFTRYTKKPGEDLNSILTGILQPKGCVHIAFGPCLDEELLRRYDGCTHNEYHRQVTRLLDREIRSRYRLSPNNFIAHDLLYGQTRHADRYTSDLKEAFLARLEELSQFDVADNDLLRDIFLGIYASPVDYGNEFDT